MRTMHIRNGKESAVLADDNFEPSYQPIRFRREELKILPGDMIYASEYCFNFGFNQTCLNFFKKLLTLNCVTFFQDARTTPQISPAL